MGRFFLFEFSIQKIQRGRIFYSNWPVFFCIFASSLFAFLQILSRSGFIVEVLDTKNLKWQNFFTRTDTVTSSLFAFLQIIIGKRVLMCSRYRKFKEAEFFNELTGFIVEVLDTKNSKRQNFSLELTFFVDAVLDTKN